MSLYFLHSSRLPKYLVDSTVSNIEVASLSSPLNGARPICPI